MGVCGRLFVRVLPDVTRIADEPRAQKGRVLLELAEYQLLYEWR